MAPEPSIQISKMSCPDAGARSSVLFWRVHESLTCLIPHAWQIIPQFFFKMSDLMPGLMPGLMPPGLMPGQDFADGVCSTLLV
jgi:hypothetical protein